MPMNPIDRELLRRYLSGEAGPEECERVEAWLREDPERWARLAEVRGELADAALSEAEVERAKGEVWARLAREVGEGRAVQAEARTRHPRARSRAFALASREVWLRRALIAAGLIALLGGGATLATLLLHRRPAASTEAVRIARTLPGQRAVIRLPDGTRVTLGVASTLRYPPTFARDARTVSLEGEAYFEVAHEERWPFAVHAGELIARDVGTRFSVRSYPEDASARVAVREGRVAIRSADKVTGGSERVVAPGQQGWLTPAGQPVIEAADTAVFFAWTEGRLVLDGVPLGEALPQLSRWFDLDFRLADSTLSGVRLSVTLRTRPTTEVLNNLAASLGMRQQRAGRIVTLFSAQPAR
jgi:transmembrane sensor